MIGGFLIQNTLSNTLSNTLEMEFDIFVQCTLVFLQTKNIITPAFDVLVATHSINRNNAAFNLYKIKKFRNGCYFIGFLFCRFLPDNETVTACPCTDNMKDFC